MERFAFIHGSSVGQSVYVPSDSPEKICNDIANKYFQGRTLRQKESATKLSLFVDLYKSTNGANYFVYSYINNNCRGANGRDGQYFALTIACKNAYAYPEPIYRMLFSAYNQICSSKKVIGINKEGEEQFLISQFKEEGDYLSRFLNKVGIAFDNITQGSGLAMPNESHSADYDAWHGAKVSIDSCNSISAFKYLCDIGRLYISAEYGSSDEKLKTLERNINKLKADNKELEYLYKQAKEFGSTRDRERIEDLTSQLNEKDREVKSLTNKNNDYKDTIEQIRKGLDKYEKIGKAITDVKKAAPKYQSMNKTDIIKTGLLLAILILTLASCVMNYAFFRHSSPFLKEIKEELSEDKKGSTALDTDATHAATRLIVQNSDIIFEDNEGNYDLFISTDGELEVPKSPQDWLTITSTECDILRIAVTPNNTGELRHCTFLIKAGDFEQQITVTQKVKGQNGSASTQSSNNFGIRIKKSNNQEIKDGDTVHNGDVLNITAKNAGKTDDYSWSFTNCSKQTAKNMANVCVRVMKTSGNTVLITYGNHNQKDIISLNIVE